MKEPRISICIPTYNFGEFIGDTLSSIAAQSGQAEEVLVVDGASTDNTADVVARFARSIPRLRYHRLQARGGIDADLAKALDLAEARYCWIFSADDLMAEHALERVLSELQTEQDVYLCGVTLCSKSMSPIRRHRILRLTEDSDFDLSDDRERRAYFELAQTSTAFFSYASSLVVNRDRWQTTSFPQEFMGSCWAHVARIFSMIPQGLRVRYLADSCVLNRGGNDSFMDRGVIQRIGLSVNGYWRLAEVYFGEHSPEARDMRRVVGNEFRIRFLLAAKAEAKASGQVEALGTLDQVVARLWQDRTPRNLAYRYLYRSTPIALAKIAFRFARTGVLT